MFQTVHGGTDRVHRADAQTWTRLQVEAAEHPELPAGAAEGRGVPEQLEEDLHQTAPPGRHLQDPPCRLQRQTGEEVQEVIQTER